MMSLGNSLYRDKTYGFMLQFPEWWTPYCVVDRTVYDRSSLYELHFLFRYKGRIYGDVFNLVVMKMTLREWKRKGYTESPLSLLTYRNGLIFAYVTPGELPEAFIDPKTGEYDEKKYKRQIRMMKRMVNRDVPRIAESFRLLTPRLAKLKSRPFLSKEVQCPCRIRNR